MSLNDQFNELARRKLEERVFPFEEGAWLQAEKAIGAQRQRRRWTLWLIPGLLMVGFLAWWAMPCGEAGAPAALRAQLEHPVVGQEAKAADLKEHDGAMSQLLEHMDGPAAALEQMPATEAADRTSEPSAPAPKASERKVQVPDAVPAMRRSEPKRAHAELKDGPQVEEAVGAGSGVATAPAPWPASAEMRTAVREPEPQVGSGEPAMPALRADAGAFVAAPDPAIADQRLDAPGQADAAHGSELGAVGGKDVAPAGSSEAVAQTAAPAATDSAAAPAGRAAASDSAAAAVPEPTLQSVAPRSPWEVTALAGLFSTTGRYRLTGVEGFTVSPERTPAFAAEAMRMGRNFGYGIGLHWGTYADRLATPGQSRTDLLLSRYWFMQSVDTTVLLITGSTLDSLGNTVYSGINVPTTVQVLRSAYDSTSVTTLVRRARRRVNRTAYMELPLLLDAHLVQGRWSFGVRGGPTLGMLTTRSGSVPGTGEDGYEELGDAVLRRCVLGWTARAYVRYRFNSAWSIGVEPALRGQLQDGVDLSLAGRRASGMGALLTLSYRLR